MDGKYSINNSITGIINLYFQTIRQYAWWEKYHRIYYYCYTLVSNAIHLDELIEILRAAIQDDIL